MTYEELKSIKNASKEDKELFFRDIFIEKLGEYLGILEFDYYMNLLYHNKYNQIRIDLEDALNKAESKVLEAIEQGNPDEVYQDRYKKIKELDNLITYFIEIQANEVRE